MTTTDDPILAPSPAEVPLRDAPLVRVIAQVRFPLVIAIAQRDFIAPFQEAIRGTYPVLRQEQTQSIVVGIGSASMAPVPPQTVWRFSDLGGKWRVSLAPDFLALETTAYTSRSDFLRRLSDVAAALDKHVEPKLVDRLGLRYIDRVTGDAVKDIERLVRPEVLGVVGAAVAKHAVHAITESLYSCEDFSVLARWGLLPPNATVDPAAIEPADVESWILDLDVFNMKPFPFSVDAVQTRAGRFAERLYAFFRWAVTSEFLRRYGGKP